MRKTCVCIVNRLYIGRIPYWHGRNRGTRLIGLKYKIFESVEVFRACHLFNSYRLPTISLFKGQRRPEF